jgi:hypothetical protein
MPPPGQPPGDARQECASGPRCHAAIRGGDGTWHGARTFQAFCPACRSVIAARLSELPEACVRLLLAARERPRTGKAVRAVPGPRDPLRLEVLALAWEMGAVLASWHERVADAARLADPPSRQAVLHRPEKAVAAAVKAIWPHRVDVLLALQPGPMTRVMFDPVKAAGWLASADPGEEGTVLPSGEAHMLPAMGGAEAGNEILGLHYRARRILGQVKARPETFDGIPCRECEAMALERAEPPSDPSRPAMHSRCAECRDEMDEAQFHAWADMYASWARSVPGLSCRRCQAGRHGECAWDACECRAGGHPACHAA